MGVHFDCCSCHTTTTTRVKSIVIAEYREVYEGHILWDLECISIYTCRHVMRGECGMAD